MRRFLSSGHVSMAVIMMSKAPRAGALYLEGLHNTGSRILEHQHSEYSHWLGLDVTYGQTSSDGRALI